MPLPPTDNLYKFLAIFGLIVATSSLFFTYIAIMDLEAQVVRLRGEAIALEREVEWLMPNPKAVVSKAERRQVERRVAELKGKKAVIRGLLEQVKVLSRDLKVPLALGLALMVVGFGLWYYRVQRYQDLILRRDAENEQVASRPKSIKARLQKPATE